MNTSHHLLNTTIKQEADELLFEKGLFGILNQFGEPHISGSYSLDLMTWRDLDIYLEVEHISESDFFKLGGMIASAFSPVKMSFRNEKLAKTNGLPDGLYWGIYLGNERAGAWKIDVWAMDKSECNRLLKHCDLIQDDLTPDKAEIIMQIKSACWQDPEYRRSFSSTDIYDAVLHNKVSSINEFRIYLKNRG
jgi:hypothetical protein